MNGDPLIEDFFVRKKRKTEKLMPKNHQEIAFTQQKLAEADRRQQMIGKVLMCPYCGKVFVAKGTRKYCYGDVCKKAEKGVIMGIAWINMVKDNQPWNKKDNLSYRI